MDRMCGNPMKTIDGNTLNDELRAIVNGHDADMTQAEGLDQQAAQAAVTNKTRHWNDKLKEIKEDWYARFRKDEDFAERESALDMASQIMGERAQRAYSAVINGDEA